MNRIFYFTLIGLSTLFFTTACKTETDKAEKTDKKETKDKQQDAKMSSRPINQSGIQMAYYVQDSVAKNFNSFREIDSTLQEKQRNYQKELESKYRAYKNYEAGIQKRMDNGEITGYQLDEIKQTAARKQQSIQQFEQQRGAALQNESMRYQNVLMNKVAEAGKEFSNEKGIDLLFFYQKGGQITYMNNAYDMTEEFVDFLNQREEELMSGFDEEVEDLDDEDLNGVNPTGTPGQ